MLSLWATTSSPQSQKLPTSTVVWNAVSNWKRTPSFGSNNLMAKQSLLFEFMAFLKHEKKWWMLPLILMLLALGWFLVFAASSPLAPFLYPFA